MTASKSRPHGPESGRTAPRHSLTPLTLPGKLIISVDCRIPATARERAARGVLLKPSNAHQFRRFPEHGLSITASVASGVTSRGESPVPPVVTTSRNPSSHAARSRVLDRRALVGQDLHWPQRQSPPPSRIRAASGPGQIFSPACRAESASVSYECVMNATEIAQSLMQVQLSMPCNHLLTSFSPNARSSLRSSPAAGRADA